MKLQNTRSMAIGTTAVGIVSLLVLTVWWRVRSSSESSPPPPSSNSNALDALPPTTGEAHDRN